MTIDWAKAIRTEYINNPLSTAEYLAAKHDLSIELVSGILSNRLYHDPSYTSPKRKGGKKRGIYIPDHIKEIKDQLSPAPTSAHRARGQNHVINKFS